MTVQWCQCGCVIAEMGQQVRRLRSCQKHAQDRVVVPASPFVMWGRVSTPLKDDDRVEILARAEKFEYEATCP